MSPLLNLTSQDFIKGLIVAVFSAPLAMIVEALSNELEINAKKVAMVALVAFLSYILKNLGTDETGKFLGKY